MTGRRPLAVAIACVFVAVIASVAASLNCKGPEVPGSEVVSPEPAIWGADARQLEQLFPPIAMTPYANWNRPKQGATYDLELDRRSGTHLPKTLWVHRVTRRIPDCSDRKSWASWARSAGIKAEMVKVKDGVWRFRDTVPSPRGGGAGRNVTMYSNLDELRYSAGDWPTHAAIYEASKKTNPRQMRKAGEARVKAMGWWPGNVHSKPLWQSVGKARTTSIPQEHIAETTIAYTGEIEGRKAEGQGLQLRIYAFSTGKLRTVALRWVNTDRYRKLPCKTLDEAFSALNRSCSMGIPPSRLGGSVSYVGWTYFVGPQPAEYVHPVFKFVIKDPRDKTRRGFPVYVPAVKSECFVDPKCQMVSVDERAKAQEQKVKEERR